jgi:hypothetical protein
MSHTETVGDKSVKRSPVEGEPIIKSNTTSQIDSASFPRDNI